MSSNTSNPSIYPTDYPSLEPSALIIEEPSALPTLVLSNSPVSELPSNSPTIQPSTDLPVAIPSSEPTVASTTSSPTVPVTICLYGNCHAPNSACVKGTICQYNNPYYSQCIEDPAFNVEKNCHRTNSWGCGGVSGPSACCNPAAICNANNNCVLPTSACVNEVPTPTGKPAFLPSAPTMQPLSTSPTFTVTSRSPVVPSNVVCLWGDCHLPTSVCAVGLVCKYSDEYYSQCVEDPKYGTASSSKCLATNSWGCGGAVGAAGPSTCCNPGAVCSADHVCVVPETHCQAAAAGAGKASLPSPAPVPVPSPTTPTTTTSTTICLYGDCSDPSTACVAGTVCQVQSAFYSQCVEDPQYDGSSSSSSGAAACHGKYDWGCGGGQGPAGCCNPFASCSAGHMCTLSTSCVYYPAAKQPQQQTPVPQVTMISTIGLAVPAGTTSLDANDQKAICLSSELSVSAPVGSCVFLGSSTTPGGLLSSSDSSPSLSALVLESKSHKLHMKSHAHQSRKGISSSSILYATTKIVAPANQFKSFSQLQNVTLLYKQMKNDFNSAVNRGNFTQALHLNSRKLNATATTTAIITSTNTAPFMNFIPTIQPTTFAPMPRSQTTESSSGLGGNGGSTGLTDAAKNGIIGGLVGGFALIVIVAFGVVFYRRKHTTRANEIQELIPRDDSKSNPRDMKSISSESQVVYVA